MSPRKHSLTLATSESDSRHGDPISRKGFIPASFGYKIELDHCMPRLPFGHEQAIPGKGSRVNCFVLGSGPGLYENHQTEPVICLNAPDAT